ncbi:MAG TPA: DUF2255 family protein [Pseudomonadales bacterium]|jgi:hypothetical protein|nr:DUF2255 family protein [Pseudomonadales bacterium]
MKIRSTLFAACLAVMLAACSPHDTRAGILLGGDEAPVPADWRFTDDTKEIAVQVHTPYLIPHAVTIWCAQVDGQLYVAASNPKTKRWPGWVDDDPNVRLRIGDKTYPVRLVPLDDPNVVAGVQAAYAAKYQLTARTGEAPPDVRYWHVTARSDAAS